MQLVYSIHIVITLLNKVMQYVHFVTGILIVSLRLLQKKKVSVGSEIIWYSHLSLSRSHWSLALSLRCLDDDIKSNHSSSRCFSFSCNQVCVASVRQADTDALAVTC